MGDAAKSRRFQVLRGRELAGDLTEAEQAELAGLIRELEEGEAALLAPALQRLRQENVGLELEAARLARQQQELATLLARKEAYLAEAEQALLDLSQRLS